MKEKEIMKENAAFKEHFQTPTVEIILFTEYDVIITSITQEEGEDF